MKITFEIDTGHDRACEVNKNDYRAAAALLLHLIGDLNDDDALAAHTHGAGLSGVQTADPKVPAAPSNATAPGITSNVAPVVVSVPPPPSTVAPATAFSPPPPPPVPVGTNNDEGEDTEAPASNVIQGNFTQPSAGSVPPPPPALTANTAAPIPPANPATNAAGVGTVVSVEVDSANMPYDARIHQKSKNKMKNGCWKIIKGLDPTILAAVTSELAASKGAVAPVSLPQPQGAAGSVPVPPPPPNTAATGVPTPPVTALVPVPPVPAVGAVSTFRELIEKITAATKANQITPQDVSRLCQHRGAPNLMQLNSMPELLPKVTADIEAVLAGLSVDMVIAGLG